MFKKLYPEIDTTLEKEIKQKKMNHINNEINNMNNTNSSSNSKSIHKNNNMNMSINGTSIDRKEKMELPSINSEENKRSPSIMSESISKYDDDTVTSTKIASKRKIPYTTISNTSVISGIKHTVHATSLDDAMENIHSIKNLHIGPPVRLPSSCVGNDGAAVIAKILQSPAHHLQGLHLWQNFIGSNGTEELATSLATVEGGRLTQLDLSWNPEIGDDGCVLIAKSLLSDFCMLKKLAMSGCNLSDIGINSLCDSIIGIDPNSPKESNSVIVGELHDDENEKNGDEKNVDDNDVGWKCSSLTSLSLYANNISEVGATAIGKALRSENCLLNKLDLRVNSISDNGCIAIFSSLKDGIKSNALQNVQSINTIIYPTKLMHLDLEKNNLTNKCMKPISDALSSNLCNIQRLILCNNNISDYGCKMIAKGLLHSNNTLLFLDLNQNQITNDGIF